MMGSKRNYHSLAKHHSISGINDVYCLDLRNHGASPHTNIMSVPLMAEDVIHFMDDHELEHINLLGHSLGGRVAIDLTINHPKRVKNQIIVDTGPFDYYDTDKFPHALKTKKVLDNLTNINLINTNRTILRQ
jgi:esterase